MSAWPAYVLETGLVTGVGLNAPATCAAIRAGLTAFVETHFVFDGDWLVGAPVPFEEGLGGRERLLLMVTQAVSECLQALGDLRAHPMPLLLCLPEPGRSMAFTDLDGRFVREVEQRAGLIPHRDSTWLASGRVSGAQALDYARRFIAVGHPQVLIAGVDTMLAGDSLSAYHGKRLLQTADNSDGFIPGEGAAAILVSGTPEWSAPVLSLEGIGYGKEPASGDSGEPLRADGLVQAIQGALDDAGVTLAAVDYRLTDNSGSQRGFKEAALGMSRLLRERKVEFDIWHPSDCVGEVGASIGPLLLGVALFALRNGYAPGPRVLCHLAADGSERAAMILNASSVARA